MSASNNTQTQDQKVLYVCDCAQYCVDACIHKSSHTYGDQCAYVYCSVIDTYIRCELDLRSK